MPVVAGEQRMLAPARWQITPLVRVAASLGVLVCFAAALTGRGELVGIAVPALLWLVVAGVAQRAEHADVRWQFDVGRCTEGDLVRLTVSAVAEGARVGARMLPDALVEVVDGPTPAPAPGSRDWTLRVPHWGLARPRFEIVATSAGGAWQSTSVVRSQGFVVEPAFEGTRGTFRGVRSRPSYGERPVRTSGAGNEFLEVRQWTPGEPLRRVHWPATQRTGQLHVAGMAATRNQDVVLVVDSSSGSPSVTAAALDRAARAAVTLARAHLAAGDRVGLVCASPDLHWDKPGSGRRQLVKIVDVLLEARRSHGFVRPALDRLPSTVLTPGALVVFLSPLLGDDATAMIAGTRRRGHPTVVIDVLDREPQPTGSAENRRALRLWRLERAAVRFELAGRGVVVLPWPAGQPLAGVLAATAARPIAAAGQPMRTGIR